MEAWSIEEAYAVRPLGSLALAVALPFLTDAALARIAGDPGTLARARPPVRAAVLALAFAIGGTALGPALAEAPGGVASLAAAALCAAVAGIADLRAAGPADPRGLAGAFAAALAGALLVRALGASATVLGGACALFACGLYAYRRPAAAPRTGHPLGALLGGAAALFLLALVTAPAALTAIAPDDAPYHGEATWRLRIDPWDATAMLASGWAARSRGELGRARARAIESVRMGGPEGPALELEAEILAARGECAAARATFDRAIEARARAAFADDSLPAPLVLGGYRLPPALLTECGGLDELGAPRPLRLR
ncbi:MAG: hypothetical protein KF729_32770 [Sandaracinaceae bacterium]|nr:hypothetical protein [Sandaracinaceae bacterium]